MYEYSTLHEYEYNELYEYMSIRMYVDVGSDPTALEKSFEM